MKKIVGMVAALAMSAACFTACGDKEEAKGPDVTGKWECTEFTYQDQTVSDNFQGVPVGAMLQVEFTNDNKGYISVIGGQRENLEWKPVDDDSIQVKTGEGDTEEKVEFTKDGDTLVATKNEGADKTSFKLVKVDEFQKFDLGSLMGAE